MTNAEIIAREKIDLIKNKIIKPEEDIHTYTAWRRLGYSVRKGEHAIAKFPIWKYATTTDKETDTETDPKIFMKLSHFFSTSQVEAR